jgi:hypothetical protein
MKPFSTYCGEKTPGGACFKWYIGNYEISLAADDFCQHDGIFRRSDIKVYAGENFGLDITGSVFDRIHPNVEGTPENIQFVFNWCQNH